MTLELPEPRGWTRAQVAARLGVSYDWFSRHWRRLTSEEGFPRPVPGLAQRWDAHAVEAWFDRQLPDATNDNLVDFGVELDRRATTIVGEISPIRDSGND